MTGKPKAPVTSDKQVLNNVFQLKITLKEVKPPIWRRIQVRDDITLHDLHKVIQKLMDWEDSHLHGFDVKNDFYGMPGEDGLNEKKFRLKDLNLNKKSKFLYIYDFGDNWKHEVLLEDILPMDASVKYPVCLGGKRSGPIEDCGGPWGYQELLDILKDPEHPDYEDRLEWVPDNFYPELFDVSEMNKRLKSRRK